jgi:hypothetical protein
VPYFFCIFFYFVEEDSLITKVGVSNEAKNVISLNFLRIMRNKNVLPLVNSTQGHTVYFMNIERISTNSWIKCIENGLILPPAQSVRFLSNNYEQTSFQQFFLQFARR